MFTRLTRLPWYALKTAKLQVDLTPMPEIKATHIKRDNTKFSSTAEFYSGLNGVCFKSACPVDF